ncbi:uncharacterized protein LOC121733459 [Aricia agestis]|uniref:uncharacterized protein LOC121733459 n=1 Tax=Aricia agestis TaxID=91739 RepID=UPI001C203ACD|nr:uncharacterized protein LOC121733459 [Aricia agestis]
MVRVTSLLLRVPAIKFRKGGVQFSPATPGVSMPSSQAAASPRAQAAAMSSVAISDVDLPPRYRRRPLSQEEIDIINGGGVA